MGSRAQIGLISSAEAGRFAEDHVAKVLQLDPRLARARFLEAAFLVWGDWDFGAGEAEFRRAIELDPNDAEIQVLYGHVLAILGRCEEGVEHAERARQLDPLNPFVHGLHGSLLVFVGRMDEAISVLQDMIAKYPGAQFGVDMLGDALHAAGRDAEALQLYSRIYRSLGHQAVADALAGGIASGDFPAAWEKAAAAVAASSRSGAGLGPWMVANFYGFAGAGEQALDWLEIAASERNQNIPYMGVMPAFSGLHDHPRFRKQAQDAGVPLVRPDSR